MSEPERRAGSLETGVNFLLVEMAEGLARGPSLLCFKFALLLCNAPRPVPAQTSVKCATHRSCLVLWGA